MQRRESCVVLGLLLTIWTASASQAAIRDVVFDENADSLDLTAAGTLDWATFGRGEMSSGETREFSPEASDSKRGGHGIVRRMDYAGLTRGWGGSGIRDYRFTGGGWCYDDGTRRKSLIHWTGFLSGSGMAMELGRDGTASFQFRSPNVSPCRAYLLLRRDQPVRIVARQGDVERLVDINDTKVVGVASVDFDGPEPLVIELRPGGDKGTVRGIAAALTALSDARPTLPPARTPRDVLLTQVANQPEPDYLKLARDYADCMIEHGRDRYGKQHSALFASTLTRDDPPALLPYPEFEPSQNHGKLDNTIADRIERQSWWKFNNFKNLPTLHQLGSEDAHKETVTGEDVLEHVGLYRTLWKLTELTGDPRYRDQADEALAWWFAHTQSPTTGLYPWGEHLGWDFRYDAVSYSTGPVQWLYSCIHHEPRAVYFADFLDILAAVPARSGADRTPLERFALGLRDWHVWDLEKGYFTRHGDYFGRIEPHGNSEFPRIAGWFFDVWSRAYTASEKPEFRREMARSMELLIDALDRRVRDVGYYPFTAVHETSDRKPEAYADRQCMNAAAKIFLAAQRIRDTQPQTADKLARFAQRELDYFTQQERADGKLEFTGGMALTLKASYEMTGRDDMRTLFRRAADAMAAEDVSRDAKAQGPEMWAQQVEVLAGAYLLFGDAKYLDAAKLNARCAAALFFDDQSPLPKVSSEPIYLPDGEPFPAYYHGALGCDDLVYALVLLAAATSNEHHQ